MRIILRDVDDEGEDVNRNKVSRSTRTGLSLEICQFTYKDKLGKC